MCVVCSRNDLRLKRHLELTTGLDSIATTEILQYHHILTSLGHWVEWRGKGGELEGEGGTGEWNGPHFNMVVEEQF